MTDMEKLRRDIEELRTKFNNLRSHVEKMEKLFADNNSKNMELQGKIATLAGRIQERR